MFYPTRECNANAYLSNSVDIANSYLSQFQPLILLFAIPVAQKAIKMVETLYENGVVRTFSNLAGRAALSLPFVKKMYDQKLDAQLAKFQEGVIEKWKKFGYYYTNIPEQGMTTEALVHLIEAYAGEMREGVEKQHFSGSIYSDSLNKNDKPVLDETIFKNMPPLEGATAKEAAELKRLFLLVYEKFYLCNPLHGSEFSIGSFINHQLIQMVGNQFGGKTREIAGFVTSGGTESLMTAARGYVNWGVREKGLTREQCIIVAPDSIHAALNKAQQDYGFKLVTIRADESGEIESDHLQKIKNQYGKQIVAFFGSSPSYPKGKIDPIETMGKMAKELGCGMHVDCCLGAALVDMLTWEESGIEANYLEWEGVTSLSYDFHKIIGGPKGGSAVVTKKMPTGRNLAFYPMYSVPDWSGGLYGTPTTAGSQSSVPAITAFIALLKMGKKGCQERAGAIYQSAQKMGEIIERCKGLKLLGPVHVNVVAFKIDPEMNYEEGAIYGFTHEMEKQGFTCSNIAGDAAHFCVTGRFAADPTALQRFEMAAQRSMENLAQLNREKRNTGKEFPGEASIYGEIGAALHPAQSGWSIGKLVQNLLFGRQGAHDAVNLYNLAHSNPYLDRSGN